MVHQPQCWVTFGAVTMTVVPDNDLLNHPFELQGNMRIDGDIYSFSSGVKVIQLKVHIIYLFGLLNL